ncbi:GTP-binding protein GEM [Nephila pilipes]|uniref:GTP-binding protein GEM n=1 Tax=Nephila pilipes TaxID=299642 RepID=A0A8X6IJT1_NEPPI|nr:GTP-binding protein GEM [Nephila pilipes]GFT51464.1 GTP-binding protein GEM [Nephila pilipes]GFT92321.1 GTP-binding protein GEM [Nephila pilipes]GFU60929.1 GTP-binding protein GEM [Nephila pilipes]
MFFGILLIILMNVKLKEISYLKEAELKDVLWTENFSELHNPDAYLVVYSVTSKRSLQLAKEILMLIHKWDNVDSKALILVGNKTDLARHRVLSTDGEDNICSILH